MSPSHPSPFSPSDSLQLSFPSDEESLLDLLGEGSGSGGGKRRRRTSGADERCTPLSGRKGRRRRGGGGGGGGGAVVLPPFPSSASAGAGGEGGGEKEGEEASDMFDEDEFIEENTYHCVGEPTPLQELALSILSSLSPSLSSSPSSTPISTSTSTSTFNYPFVSSSSPFVSRKISLPSTLEDLHNHFDVVKVEGGGGGTGGWVPLSLRLHPGFGDDDDEGEEGEEGEEGDEDVRMEKRGLGRKGSGGKGQEEEDDTESDSDDEPSTPSSGNSKGVLGGKKGQTPRPKPVPKLKKKNEVAAFFGKQGASSLFVSKSGNRGWKVFSFSSIFIFKFFAVINIFLFQLQSGTQSQCRIPWLSSLLDLLQVVILEDESTYSGSRAAR